MEISKAVCLWVTLGDRKMICHKAMLLSRSDSSHAVASQVLGKRQTLIQQVWVWLGSCVCDKLLGDAIAGPGTTLCIGGL